MQDVWSARSCPTLSRIVYSFVGTFYSVATIEDIDRHRKNCDVVTVRFASAPTREPLRFKHHLVGGSDHLTSSGGRGGDLAIGPCERRVSE